MTSTLKFNNWQDAAGNAIYDSSNGGLPVSGNAIINGDFGVWQRGTTFTGLTATAYTADRWVFIPGTDTADVSRQSFTAGDIEAIGYGDAEYFLRLSPAGTGANARIDQRIEDVRAFAGQQVTASFWAKASASASLTLDLRRNFGSGGSSGDSVGSNTFTLSTSWVRYSLTVTLPTVAGKTIGSGSYLLLRFLDGVGVNEDFDLWGVQLEAGPVATPFKLAGGGSKAAELALCQRYYYSLVQSIGFNAIGVAVVSTTTSVTAFGNFPVEMRTAPTAQFITSGTIANDWYLEEAAVGKTVSAVGGVSNKSIWRIDITSSSLTAGRAARLFTGSATNVGPVWSAEL